MKKNSWHTNHRKIVPRDKRRKYWKDTSPVERATFWTSLALGILTLLLFVVAACQYLGWKETSRRELRAYLSVLPPSIVDSLSRKPLQVSYVLKNSGQTTAFEVRHSAVVKIVTNIERDTIPDPQYEEVDTAQFILAPNTEIVRPISPPKDTPQSWLGYDSKTHRIIFYGKVTYRDIYGEKHWMSYFYEVVFLYGNQFIALRRGNDADKDY